MPRGARVGWKLLALAVVLLAALLPRIASASRPVITPGREGEVEALFDPHALGDELSPGWTLHGFRIDRATIEIHVAGPDGAFARVTLDHPDWGRDGARMLDGFALEVVDAPPGSEPALVVLTETIERNDDGQFWRVDARARAGPEASDQGWRRTIATYARDGTLLLFGLALTLLVLVVHKLRDAERWHVWALLAAVGVGLALRLALSPQVALAPWPYTRVLVPAKLIYEGPVLARLAAAAGSGPIRLTETITTTALLYAALAPLAMYAHARYLLDDPRAAVFAACVVAILPLHIRFSHSDVAFIPSITVSSTAFALVHAGTRERRAGWGWLATLLLALPVALTYEVRPLNILYYPLFVATAFVDVGLHTDKPALRRDRAVAAFAIVSLVTFGRGVPQLLADYGAPVHEGLSWTTLGASARVLFSPRMNALLNPAFTPPGLTVFAIVGAIDLWRRQRRRLFAFIVLWLLAFLIAHAYVVPTSPLMQARYHLHLIVPYMLLAVCGLDAGVRWLAKAGDRLAWLRGRERVAIALVAGYVLASPAIHAGFIRDVAFNDAREWRFVHELRGAIPARCTVVEFVGRGADSRLERVGATIRDGVPRSQWRVVALSPAEPEGPPVDDVVRDLFDDPPACLYWYEGLPCFGHKPIDEHKASACDAVEGFVQLEPVRSVAFESRVYDGNLGEGLREGDRVELTLYRVLGRRGD